MTSMAATVHIQCKKKIKYDSYTSCGGAIFTVRFAMETQDKFYHNSVVYQSFFPLSLSLCACVCMCLFPLLSQTELAALSHRTNYVCLLLCWIYACSSFVERLHLCAAIFLSFLFHQDLYFVLYSLRRISQILGSRFMCCHFLIISIPSYMIIEMYFIL